jgi:hypothetical protein
VDASETAPYDQGIPMDRKYGHKGYQESSREDRERDRERKRPPVSPLTPEERAQQRSLKHAVQREANEVLRCPNCGKNVPGSGAIGFDTRCPLCDAALHACRACRHFDSSARWECRAAITAPVADKSKENSCTLFEARLVLDATGRRSGAPGASNDPKSQFENLFKR